MRRFSRGRKYITIFLHLYTYIMYIYIYIHALVRGATALHVDGVYRRDECSIGCTLAVITERVFLFGIVSFSSLLLDDEPGATYIHLSPIRGLHTLQ